jgi:2-hydroxy-6-oxonona-2,4-dienedioate hydrolase
MTAWVELMGAEVRVGGSRYLGRYIEAGKGQPLLLLHGQGGHVENFSRNIAAYAKHFHVFALDLAWHGYGPQPNFDPELLPVWVDQTLDFMDWQGLRSAHVEGQSMGGWVAMRLAHDHPSRLLKMVLTTAQGFSLSPSGDKADAALPGADLLKAFLPLLQDPSLENMRKRMTVLFANPSRLPEEAVEIRRKLYANPIVNESLQQVLQSYMGGPGSPCRKHIVDRKQLEAIRHKTLVYWSEKNPLPPAVGHALSGTLPNSRCYVAADTGHWAQFENADEHNREVLKFLTEA